MGFLGNSSSESLVHFPFTQSYGAYVDQRLRMKAVIQFPTGEAIENDPAVTKLYAQYSGEELMTALPVVSDTIDFLFALEMNISTCRSPVAIPAVTVTLRDLPIVCNTLQSGPTRLLDISSTVNSSDGVNTVDVYKRFAA